MIAEFNIKFVELKTTDHEIHHFSKADKVSHFYKHPHGFMVAMKPSEDGEDLDIMFPWNQIQYLKCWGRAVE